MADTVIPAVRSRMMAGIKSKNTKPEMMARQGLHAKGFRFRLHDSRLPGSPDMVLARHRAVLFINGCFWHGHDCNLFRLPATRTEFWQQKITSNKTRDMADIVNLTGTGWRVGILWECALKGRTRRSVQDVLAECAAWLLSAEPRLDVRGFE
jgi:DNA mismatch endonuclease, patch repair protein